MSYLRRSSWLAFAAAVCLAPAQPQQPLSFEVASVRPAGSRPPQSPFPSAGKITGGPGTGDPTRITYTWVLVRSLLMNAFGVPIDQISGSDWVMGQEGRFDISANVPAGTTKSQANEMLLNLLKERFHLAYHREKKDFDMYALVIAKGGPKLKDAAPADGPPQAAPQPGTIARPSARDRDGFPQLAAGIGGFEGVTVNGITRQTFRKATMQVLLNSFKVSMGGSRFVDKTGLTGKYDFTLAFSRAGLPQPTGLFYGRGAPPPPEEIDNPSGGPTLFSALEKQLGLKLEKSRTQLDVIVVDHMDKQPTAN